jgi:hypothetical protein
MVTLSGVIPNVGDPSKINNVKMIVIKFDNKITAISHKKNPT